MSDPRVLGLTLMAIATAGFLGSTSEALPSAVFFPAFMLFVIGAFKFLRKNHEAMAKAEERAQSSVSPKLRENRMAKALADQQATPRVTGASPTRAAQAPPTESVVAPIDIELDDQDVEVTTDVSFPIEVQTGEALADQLSKLNRLLEQGVLTAEEYAVAKSKLLD